MTAREDGLLTTQQVALAAGCSAASVRYLADRGIVAKVAPGLYEPEVVEAIRARLRTHPGAGAPRRAAAARWGRVTS